MMPWLYRNLSPLRTLRELIINASSTLQKIEGRLSAIEGQVGKITGAQLARLNVDLLGLERYRDSKRLNAFEHQVFSQNGEDGIIAEIFRRLGEETRYFVEIGAGDGLENNTVFLLQQGWRGIWIEADGKNAQDISDLQRDELASGRLGLINTFVSAENIADVLQRARVPSEFDLLSVDIDRNTYYVWKALKEFRPRVVVVEYNAQFPPHVDWKVEYEPDLLWNGTMYFGASLKALEKLGTDLGYALVGCDLHGVNAFFVRSDLCSGRFHEPYTAENHFESARFWLVQREGHPRGVSDRVAPKRNEGRNS
jgi:hypothetical protein